MEEGEYGVVKLTTLRPHAVRKSKLALRRDHRKENQPTSRIRAKRNPTNEMLEPMEAHDAFSSQNQTL